MSLGDPLNASRVAARTCAEVPGLDQPGAQREAHQHVVGRDLPALRVGDLEPAAASADLREQLRLLGQRVGVGLEGGEPRQQAALAAEPAVGRGEQPGGAAAVVAGEPGGEVAPQRGAAVGVGDGLAVDLRRRSRRQRP